MLPSVPDLKREAQILSTILVHFNVAQRKVDWLTMRLAVVRDFIDRDLHTL